MKNIKINSPLFIYSFMFFFFINIFNANTQQDCQKDITMMNSKLRTNTHLSTQTIGPYESCVNALSSNGNKREEFIIDAYKNLIEYYRKQNDFEKIGMLKSMIRKESAR